MRRCRRVWRRRLRPDEMPADARRIATEMMMTIAKQNCRRRAMHSTVKAGRVFVCALLSLLLAPAALAQAKVTEYAMVCSHKGLGMGADFLDGIMAESLGTSVSVAGDGNDDRHRESEYGFITTVNRMIGDGWQPLGGGLAAQAEDGLGHFCQAMVKREG